MNDRQLQDSITRVMRKHAEEIRQPKSAKFDASDTATILAALRLFQRTYEDCDAAAIAEAFPEHFEFGTRVFDEQGQVIEQPVIPQPLGSEDIDLLCERINCGEPDHLSAALDAMDELAEILKETHENEIEDDHGGDGAAGCSYCAAIIQAETVKREALNQPPLPVLDCYRCKADQPIVTDEGERYCLICGSTDVAGEGKKKRKKKTPKPVVEQDETLCTCANRSWYGDEHDTACELKGKR